MMRLEETAAILLCAGFSRRFGNDNKLTAHLHGKPLAAHAADTISSLPYGSRMAVLPGGQRDPALREMLAAKGFHIVENPRPSLGKDSSIRIGVRKALTGKPGAILVALGDMPFVTSGHLISLAAATSPTMAAASAVGERWSPPLVMPLRTAEAIMLQAEVPIRTIIAANGVAGVQVNERDLTDFDTAEDFLVSSPR